MTIHTADTFRAKSYDVFVSYKRGDDAAREVLVSALEAAGYEVFWDGKLNQDDWKGELRDEINRSNMVICLWSAKAAASQYVKAEAYHAFGIKKLLSAPIEDKSVVPQYFRGTNLHLFDAWADEIRREAQIEKILGTLQRVTGGPSRKRGPTTAAVESSLVAPPEFGAIPGAPDKLIGRDAELAMLRDAWASRPPNKVNAVVLHALGGAGKSALLRTFANELLAAGGGGAARLYGWSAYSQGSGEQKRADADGFVSKALVDFGYRGNPLNDPVERARALAKLIQKERVLLLLDGLEPLQDPPSLNKGRFKDKGLAELIKLLAAQNPGLVVLTTRQEVPELGGYGPLVINHPLEVLSDRAGADLLVELGVHGRQRELEAAARELDGHALSVTLLGTYLAEVCGGDIRHRDQFDFPDIVVSPTEQSELVTDKTIIAAKRAAKVIRGYLEQFEKLATDPKRRAEGHGGPERALLHLLGLFDRTADGSAVDALLAQHIPGLTDELFFETNIIRKGVAGLWRKVEVRELTARERGQRIRFAKDRLRKLRLLAKPNPADLHELDAHPMVRAYFTGQLEKTARAAARIAHEILYRHYAAAAPHLPDTLEAMQPLFHAVQHGVKAGLAAEVYQSVFRERIRQGNHQRLLYEFGSFGGDLAVLANFFDGPWLLVKKDFDQAEQARILVAAANDLNAIGRLRDAAVAIKSAVDMYARLGRLEQTIGLKVVLSSMETMLGELRSAEKSATEALSDAEAHPQLIQLCAANLGVVCSLRGNLDRAESLFEMAERRKGSQLHQHWGFWFCDLLLHRGDANSVERRALTEIKYSESSRGRKKAGLTSGYAQLITGLAQHARKRPSAAVSLDLSVEHLRESGNQFHLPLALLARSAHRRGRVASDETDLIEGIRADLAEVEDIAGDEMRLYLTDLALERARLALDVSSAFPNPEAARAEAQAQTAKAVKLIADTGYHRRDGELTELKARLAAA